ncbi:MAG: hypothetical protein V2B18_23845 [Pseudomonadota bacterium]
MCYYLVVGIPEKIVNKALAGLPSGVRALAETDYGGLAEHMPGCSLRLIVEQGCSCGIYHRIKPKGSTREERLRKKYKRLRGSDARVEKAPAEVGAKHDGSFIGLREDVRRWLREIIRAGLGAYLYVHWASDEIPMNPRKANLCFRDLSGEPGVPEGVLVAVRP